MPCIAMSLNFQAGVHASVSACDKKTMSSRPEAKQYATDCYRDIKTTTAKSNAGKDSISLPRWCGYLPLPEQHPDKHQDTKDSKAKNKPLKQQPKTTGMQLSQVSTHGDHVNLVPYCCCY
jgi:hypothetical protein